MTDAEYLTLHGWYPLKGRTIGHYRTQLWADPQAKPVFGGSAQPGVYEEHVAVQIQRERDGGK